MNPTVLILGAAGRLGQQLTLAFARAGWRTLAQSRKPLPAALCPRPGVEPLYCDAYAQQQLLESARGATVVVNALNPPYAQWDRLALPLAAAAQELAQRLDALLMLPGNVYGFGRTLPPLLDLETPEVGDTSKGRIRIAIEKRMADAVAQGLDSVVLRAGDFFGGSQDGSWLDRVIVRELARGRMRYPGPLEVTHAWAYLPDLAQCFVRVAALRAQLRGHHRLHFAGHAIDGQALRQGLQQACGRPVTTGSLPWGLMRLGALALPDLRAIMEMRYLWQRPHALDDTALRALIGRPPLTPLALALRQSLADLGWAGLPTPSAGDDLAFVPGEPCAPDQPSRAFFSSSARS
jgi:nucleoside-diphosphate-sugar epimerase